MINRLLFCILFSFCLFAAGCRSVPARNSQPVSNIEEQPPDLTNLDKLLSEKRGEYKINPLDLLEITVYQEPDLTRTVRVSQDGFISCPLIGEVKVQGLSAAEVEKEIAQRLEKDYLVNPQVNVFIKEYRSKNVVVMGEVKTPGSYELPQGRQLTVLEAVALAGGFTALAAVDGTRVIRVENGVQKYIKVRISEITKGGDKSRDIVLQPDDIIFIPERIF